MMEKRTKGMRTCGRHLAVLCVVLVMLTGVDSTRHKSQGHPSQESVAGAGKRHVQDRTTPPATQNSRVGGRHKHWLDSQIFSDQDLKSTSGRQVHSPSSDRQKRVSRTTGENSNCTSAGQMSAEMFQDLNMKKASSSQTEAFFEAVLCHLYEPWSAWRPCNRKCQQVRVRKCRASVRCGRRKLRQRRSCRRKGGLCAPSYFNPDPSYPNPDPSYPNPDPSYPNLDPSYPDSNPDPDYPAGKPQDGARAISVSNDRYVRVVKKQVYDIVFTKWSAWGSCTRSCKQRRRRRCKVRDICSGSLVQETRDCGDPGTRCYRRLKKKKNKEWDELYGDSDDDDDSGENSDEDDKGYVLSVDHVDQSPFYEHLDEAIEGLKGTGKPKNKKKKKEEARKDKEKEDEDEEEDGWHQTMDSDHGFGKGDPEQRHYEKPDADADNFTEVQGDILRAGLLDTCGIRPPTTRGSLRIIGGRESQPFTWPWQVALLTRWNEQYCGGTLVAPNWMMTAAHCVRKKGNRRRFIVRTGEHNLEDFEGQEQDIRSLVEFPHPGFDQDAIVNDIALVRLREVPDLAHPGYACLPEKDFVPDGPCRILGWGKRKHTHIFGAESLLEVEVPIVPHKRCQKVFQYDIDNRTQLCAGVKRGGRDACAGDSGGPLLCPRVDKDTGDTRWYLMGITSYGEGCGRRGKFGIYTRVASYRKWIADAVKQFEKKYLKHR